MFDDCNKIGEIKSIITKMQPREEELCVGGWSSCFMLLQFIDYLCSLCGKRLFVYQEKRTTL